MRAAGPPRIGVRRRERTFGRHLTVRGLRPGAGSRGVGFRPDGQTDITPRRGAGAPAGSSTTPITTPGSVPTDQWLWPTSFDPNNRVMRYRAKPTVCNSCPVKADCTTSQHGREVSRQVDPWPFSEAGRFHRGIACAIASLAFIMPLAQAVITHSAADVLVVGHRCVDRGGDLRSPVSASLGDPGRRSRARAPPVGARGVGGSRDRQVLDDMGRRIVRTETVTPDGMVDSRSSRGVGDRLALVSSLKVMSEYERGVVFRAGRVCDRCTARASSS